MLPKVSPRGVPAFLSLSSRTLKARPAGMTVTAGTAKPGACSDTKGSARTYVSARLLSMVKETSEGQAAIKAFGFPLPGGSLDNSLRQQEEISGTLERQGLLQKEGSSWQDWALGLLDSLPAGKKFFSGPFTPGNAMLLNARHGPVVLVLRSPIGHHAVVLLCSFKVRLDNGKTLDVGLVLDGDPAHAKDNPVFKGIREWQKKNGGSGSAQALSALVGENLEAINGYLKAQGGEAAEVHQVAFSLADLNSLFQTSVKAPEDSKRPLGYGLVTPILRSYGNQIVYDALAKAPKPSEKTAGVMEELAQIVRKDPGIVERFT